jgi:hypothetical protein
MRVHKALRIIPRKMQPLLHNIKQNYVMTDKHQANGAMVFHDKENVAKKITKQT